MNLTQGLALAVSILATLVIPGVISIVRMHNKIERLEHNCIHIEKIASHEVRIALLEATVAELKRVPETLNRIEGYLRPRQ